MRVTHVPCGPFANESERRAFKAVQGALAKVDGTGTAYDRPVGGTMLADAPLSTPSSNSDKMRGRRTVAMAWLLDLGRGQ